jgi:hypothetical protein
LGAAKFGCGKFEWWKIWQLKVPGWPNSKVSTFGWAGDAGAVLCLTSASHLACLPAFTAPAAGAGVAVCVLLCGAAGGPAQAPPAHHLLSAAPGALDAAGGALVSSLQAGWCMMQRKHRQSMPQWPQLEEQP